LGYRETDLRLLKRLAVDQAKRVAAVTPKKTLKKSGKAAVVALSDRCFELMVEAMNQPITSSEYVFTTEEPAVQREHAVSLLRNREEDRGDYAPLPR
jgi:hypothetical protein